MPKPVLDELPESKVTPDPKLEKRGRREFTPEYKLKIIGAYNESEIVVCGMTIGYADFSAIENSLETERVPFEEFVTVYD